MSTARGPWLEELSYDECLELLASRSVGRIAVVVHDFPVILPVNYRLVATTGVTWIVLRTRHDNVIERAGLPAAFEIDSVDTLHREGWSVLVRGTLHHVDPDGAELRDRFDPQPWVAEGRRAWLAVVPFSITGRRLHATERGWAFHTRAYL